MLPSLFPSVDWFNEYLKNDSICFYEGKFNPKDHRAVYQYEIAEPNKILALSVPINRRESHFLIRDIKISYDHKWIREHINALQTSYGKSPFYEFYDYKIIPALEKKHPFLIDLNLQLIELLLGFFQLEKKEFGRFHEPVFIPSSPSPVKPYSQVFDDRFGFREPLSALDLLFNLGPMCSEYFNP